MAVFSIQKPSHYISHVTPISVMCLNEYVQYDAYCKYDHDGTVCAGSSSNCLPNTVTEISFFCDYGNESLF